MTIKSAREYSDEDIYELLQPYISRWFRENYESFTPPQRFAIPHILSKSNILISAPTGTGKTFACFLGIINYLCKLAEDDKLEDRIYCLYTSPLRALSNDIYRNLEIPLAQIKEIAKRMGIGVDIRIAVRTGDTPSSEKQKMLRKPPHILITTPETASIILNAPRFRRHLMNLDYVIVDEVHELAGSKRGAHLSITLERLQYWCESEFARVGMSATIAPTREVAKFLVGYSNGKLRDCLVADASYAKRIEIKVISPSDVESTETTGSMYKHIKSLIDAHRSTLVFTNTRSGAERVSYNLSRMYKDGNIIGTHHGSLSKDTRLKTEEGLKSGDMKAVACSSSLELGVDIGALDLCILVGSPKSVTRLIQRVGRSGHKLQARAKGYLVVLDRDDLVECAVLATCALNKKLDRVQIVGEALDVLAQHIVGMALNQKWGVKEAYEIVKRAYPYRKLRKGIFESVLEYLSGEYGLEERKVYPKIWYSKAEKVFGRRGGTVRGIYMTHVGTIPSEVSIQVFCGNKWVGKIDEPFLERLYKGDIFVLGGKTYEFIGSRGTRAYVSDASGRNPTIPSWIGEMLPLDYDSAIEIGKFREKMLFGNEKWLIDNYNLSKREARQICEYFNEQISYVGEIPTHRKIIIEEFRDEMGLQNIVFHALYGRRTNDALSRAYAYEIMRAYKANVSVTINDNGFILKTSKNVKTEDVPYLVKSNKLEEILRKSIRNTELFKRRYRHCAVRGLMVLKQYKNHEIRVGKQQRSSEFILRAAERIPRFPIIEETFREILEEVFDIEHTEETIQGIENGDIHISLIQTLVPSPFAHNLVAQQASDVVMMESRKDLLKELHRKVLECINET